MLLNGDLCQMSSQKRILEGQGFSIEQTDVYPTVKEEDTERALLYFYINKTDGWWNYEDDFIKEGICTKEEFWKRFRG